MTKTMVGAPGSVVEALRRAWPKYTAKAAARAAGKSVYTGESWVQGRKRGDWDALVRLMADNADFEREILALVCAERRKNLDATGDGRGHGVARKRAVLALAAWLTVRLSPAMHRLACRLVHAAPSRRKR